MLSIGFSLFFFYYCHVMFNAGLASGMGVIAILVVITIWGLPHHVWQVLQTLCLWLKPFHPSSQTCI
jgi:hypothetical protein